MTITAHDVEALLRRYYELVDAGDLELLSTFHDDATYKRPGYPEFRGRQALQAFYSGERIIESGTHALHQIFIHGDQAAVEGTFTGTLKDGSSVQLPFSDFFDLQQRGEDLRIAARRTYFDDQQV